MVTTARASAMRCEAASTAAPPSEWPIRIAGAPVRLAQVIGGGDQIVDVRGEMRVGEFAFAGAQPGKIEAQHGDAVMRQPLGDALGGEVVLAAGEAVREQREGRRLAERQVERRGELLACGVGESEAFAAHGCFCRSLLLARL